MKNENITEFQIYIRLVVKKPVKKIWEKMFLNIVTKVGPAGIIRPVHVLDEFGASKQIHLRSYKMDDDYIYEIPLIRNLEEKEAEEIIKMWAKFYDKGDFIIETSTPYKEDETVADDSDNLMTCCEKAKLKHNKWMRNKVKEGYRYGLVYSETSKTHPMLRPWEQLPTQYRQVDESTIFGSVLQLKEAKTMTADEVLLGLKEKNPTTIQFAQSVGMPPAVITQYGELAQQVEQQDVPRKVKIAFLNAEEEIIEFIEKKISQAAKGLGKEISRRELFRGVGNLAQVLSTLSTASKLIAALPKVEPKIAAPTPSLVDWMSEDKVLEMLPYALHEEFLDLFGPMGTRLEDYVSVFNEWFKEKNLPWEAIDVAISDEEVIWKLRRTKAEKVESQIGIFPGNWDDVERDGYWDSDDFEEVSDEGWDVYDNEDMPQPRYFNKKNKELKKEGKILVWGWNGGDPGMGGASKIFKLR